MYCGAFGLGEPAAYPVTLGAVDRSRQVQRIGVVDGRLVHRLDSAPEIGEIGIFEEGAFDATEHEAQQITVSLREALFGHRRCVQLGGVDGVTSAGEGVDHVGPGRVESYSGLAFTGHGVLSLGIPLILVEQGGQPGMDFLRVETEFLQAVAVGRFMPAAGAGRLECLGGLGPSSSSNSR